SFTTDAPAPPPPSVSAVAPAGGATGVAPGTSVTVTFTGTLNASTVNASTVELLDGSGNVVSATVNFSAGTDTATLTPSAALADSTRYRVKVLGGTSGAVVQDTAGDNLPATFTSGFSTAAAPVVPPPPPPPAPPPTGAPNEPLLYSSNLQYVGAFRVP